MIRQHTQQTHWSNINTISIVANKKVRGRRKAAQGKANVRLSFGPSR